MLKNIHIIHLKHRVDREYHITQEMKKLANNYNFFDGVNGHILDYSGPLLKGEEGIRQTHLQLLKKALTENLDDIFIIEDDACFVDNIQEELAKIENVDFDLLYLGGAHKSFPIHLRENLWIPTNVVALHAVIIKKSIYQILIDIIENNPNIQVDNAYALIQPKVKSYIFYPPLAWQKEGYSDIQNTLVDYPWLKP